MQTQEATNHARVSPTARSSRLLTPNEAVSAEHLYHALREIMANETIRTRGASPQTISAWLADSLRSKILDGEFEAGERIRQDAIAALYGVSTTPVRGPF